MNPITSRGYLLTVLAAAAAIFGAGPVIACKLPVAVRDRVGRAQTFTYNSSNAEYAIHRPKRDFIWSDTGGQLSRATPQLSPNVYSGIYSALRRVPVSGHGPNYSTVAGWPLSWFARHHPDWIMYKCDRITPAFEFGDNTWVPIDISNPEVRAWRLENEIRPLLAVGYSGISVDNIAADNPFQYCGSFSGPGGAWVQRYTGNRYDDSIFVADQVTWLSQLRAYVHANSDGCVAGNIAFQPRSMDQRQRFVELVDIVFDEGGFSGGVAACEVGGGSKYQLFGKRWIEKFQYFANLGRPFVLGSNGLCSRTQPQSQAVVDWALASYLLTKNDRSYVGWFERDVAKFEEVSDFYLSHGAPIGSAEFSEGIVKRAFSAALVLLNPTERSIKHDLGERQYRDVAGNTYRWGFNLAPRSAKILIDPRGTGRN